MKLAKMFYALCAVGGALGAVSVNAAAVQPEKAMTCAEAREKYQMTAEAKERFAVLEGSCEGIYKINGSLYANVKAVVRKVSKGDVTLFLPATNRTFVTTPKPEARVLVNGKSVRPSELRKGDEINIYLSLDRFAENKVTEVSYPAEESAPEPVVAAPAVAVAPAPAKETKALPTTASPLPASALLSGLLLGLGLLVRRVRRSV